jgi:AraC-like DNA-binding protein
VTSVVPLHGLADYGPELVSGPQPSPFFVGRFEESIRVRPNRLALHRHDFYEVFWLSGAGGYFSDFRHYALSGRTLVFVSPGEVHRWDAPPRVRLGVMGPSLTEPSLAKSSLTGPSLTGPMVAFTQAFYDGADPPPSSLLHHPFWFATETPPLLVLDDVDAARVDRVWELLVEEATPSSDRDDVARALLRSLFHLAGRAYRRRFQVDAHTNEAPAGASGRTRPVMREFCLSMERHVRDHLSVTDYARLLGVTPDHLGVVALQAKGRTAGELIRARLLLEAKRLLVDTSLNVSEIAYGLGFKDPAYFSRFFRRLTGVAPGEFRESFAAGERERPGARLGEKHQN